MDFLATSRPRAPRRRRVRLQLEQLVSRCQPSVMGPEPLVEIEPNDTADVAQDLGAADGRPALAVAGQVGDGVFGAADVDWYIFRLDAAAHVHLTVSGEADAAHPVLGLYNVNGDRFDFSDPFTPTGRRLLAQTADGSGDGFLDRDLPAGTYNVAVSGAGNADFHPFLAGSGNAGQPRFYTLGVAATPLGRGPADGPRVLAFDQAATGPLARSPFVLRMQFDGELDPATVSPGGTVFLTYNPSGAFGDGADQDVPLGTFNYQAGLSELQLLPAAPLKPGYYRLVLAGDTADGAFAVAGVDGVPLGTAEYYPHGRDAVRVFQVAAGDAGDDTAPTATDLGEVAPGQIVRVAGAIGDDPYYDPAARPDEAVNPAADADMYHFRVAGPGRYALAADVFAGRIGSPLDAGISLFQADPATGALVFVDGNNNSRNAAAATNGTLPLHDDPALFVGLTEGDYYLVVTANFNTPSAADGGEPGANGLFDPADSHSGQNGFGAGPYVLSYGIRRDDAAPTVVAVTPEPGETLAAPPTEIVVAFSEAMNVRSLFFNAYEQSTQATVAAVYIVGADGTRYFPRLGRYDDEADEAHFLMLDGLANGAYQLHLSGGAGLTDLAGNALVGSEASADYVVSFTVAGPARGAVGDPLAWNSLDGNDDPAAPQDLGVLFPHELQTGVTVTRAAAAGAADTADAYRFQALQGQTYGLSLSGADLPAGVTVAVFDDAGNEVTFNEPDGLAFTVALTPGEYVVTVAGWTAEQAATLAYELKLTLVGNGDNAPALTAGPGPAMRLRLAGDAAAADRPADSLAVVLPPAPAGEPPADAGGSALGPAFVVATAAAAVSARPAAPAGAPLISLPTGALLQLAGGPLGGVPGAPAATERAALRLPAAPPAVTPAVLLTTAAVIGPETPEIPETAETPGAAGALARMFANVARAAAQYGDHVLEMWNGLAAGHAAPSAPPRLDAAAAVSPAPEPAVTLAAPASVTAAAEDAPPVAEAATPPGTAAKPLSLGLTAAVGVAAWWLVTRTRAARTPVLGGRPAPRKRIFL